MGTESSVGDLVQRANKAGTELFLYYGVVMARPEGKLSPALHAEVLRRTKEIRAFLATRFAASRSVAGATHKWVLRLGDMKGKSGGGVLKPAYLACGPGEWCMRMIRQSQELSDPANKYERARWLILEPEQVGGAIKNDRDVLVASVVALPEGVSLGGPPNSSAEIISACESCLSAPIADERVAEIVKNDD